MNKGISILLVVFLIIMYACDEDEEVYPQIETLEITTTSASNFLVKGNIIATGNALVLEYGFVYSLSPVPDVYQGTKVVAGNSAMVGPFEKNITLPAAGGAPIGYSLFVRAYLTNQKGIVYGAVKEFTVPALTIGSVAPLKARTGDQITITGVNFSLNPAENEVKFNGIIAEIIGTTATALLVKVPSGILGQTYNETSEVIVTTGGQTVTATQSFRLLPTVTDFTPKTGTFGTTITLTGSDFYPFSTSLRVGGIDASASQVTDTYVTFNIPITVTTPTLSIKLISGTDVIDVPGLFTIAVPTITSITPLAGLGGTLVTITGTGFNIGDYLYSYNTVTFGTTPAEAFNNGINEILAFAPPGLPLGTYPVSVFTGIHTVTFGTPFTITKPTISSFTPTSGIAGTYVTITGTHFGLFDEPNTVLFGASLVDIYSWADTSITVYIPLGTPSGSVKITVNASGQSVTSTGNYTIL